jgi:hypothetical protein
MASDKVVLELFLVFIANPILRHGSQPRVDPIDNFVLGIRFQKGVVLVHPGKGITIQLNAPKSPEHLLKI